MLEFPEQRDQIRPRSRGLLKFQNALREARIGNRFQQIVRRGGAQRPRANPISMHSMPMPKPAFFLLSSEARTVFGVLVALYWISESLTAARMRAGRQDRTEDRGSLRLIGIVFSLSWWIGVAVVWDGRASMGGAVLFRAGLIFMIVGQLLRWWAIATLGRLFTVNVAIRAGHQLIESGPYRYVRHPSYTAILLFHLGAALCLCNALSLIVLTVPTTVALLNRIRVEEDVLLSGLGGRYREYVTRTKRLLPGLY